MNVRKNLIDKSVYEKRSSPPKSISDLNGSKAPMGIESSSATLVNNLSENPKSAKKSAGSQVGIEQQNSSLPGITATQITSENPDAMFQIHSIRFKVKLKKIQPYFKWDKMDRKMGWPRRYYYQDEFVLEMTNKHLIINIHKKLYGKNYNKVLTVAKRFAFEVLGWLEKQGFEFGDAYGTELRTVGKPHIVFPKNFKPSLRKLGASYIIDANGFRVDDSPGHGEGELEFIGDVSDLDAAMKAPKSISELTDYLKEQQQIIFNQQQQIANQQAQIEKMLGFAKKFQGDDHNTEVDFYS